MARWRLIKVMRREVWCPSDFVRWNLITHHASTKRDSSAKIILLEPFQNCCFFYRGVSKHFSYPHKYNLILNTYKKGICNLIFASVPKLIILKNMNLSYSTCLTEKIQKKFYYYVTFSRVRSLLIKIFAARYISRKKI